MSELRKLADATQYLFKQICIEADRPQPHGHMGRVKSFVGQGLEVLSCFAAEQEALCPAPQTQKPGGITWVEDADYKSALSASPDPEGEWQWVPKGFVVAPEEPNLDMLVFGERAEPIARNIYPSKIYKAMIAARPPVPKKGERA